VDAQFWHERWENAQTAFHEADGNALFARHLDALGLSPGARVFLPLCGKTRDAALLRSRGFRVVGAELSRIAVAQMFDDLGLAPRIEDTGSQALYAAEDVAVFAGDIFDLDAETLGPVDAVYDRAALVALPPDMRARYVPHVVALTHGAPHILLTFDYDQSRMDGPPFSVPADEVVRRYGGRFTVEDRETRTIDGGLKGKVAATETLWLLNPA
jgi:thiopurine S-methyltransferase